MRQNKMRLITSTPFVTYEACLIAKSTKSLCCVPHDQAQWPFRKTHVDPHNEISDLWHWQQGLCWSFHWMMTFLGIDGAFFTKDEACLVIPNFLWSIERQYNLVVQELHLDNNTEFWSSKLQHLLIEKAIVLFNLLHVIINKMTLQNEETEWSEKNCALLIDLHLPKYFWPKASSAYSHNQSIFHYF